MTEAFTSVYVLDATTPAEPDLEPLVAIDANGADWVPDTEYIERWDAWQVRARAAVTPEEFALAALRPRPNEDRASRLRRAGLPAEAEAVPKPTPT